jgi:uncharacterized protein (TIRG00374 family)
MRKGKLLILFKLVVGLILLIVLYREINRSHNILLAFKNANPMNIMICLLLLIPNYGIQFLKWRYILRVHYAGVSNQLVFQSLLFGTTIGFITPGNLGELTRALYFKKHDKIIVTGLNILDKIYGMVIFITLGLISLLIITVTRFQWSTYVVFPIAIIGVVFLLILWIILLNPRFARTFSDFLKRRLAVPDKILHIFSSLNGVERKHSLNMCLLGFLWFLVIFSQYHIVILAFEKVALFPSYLAVSAILFTKIILPISFADLGIREGASVFYYTLYNVKNAAAFNAALLIFVINFFIPAFVGSIAVFRLRGNQNRTE